jgi:hypothetical protein
MVKIIGSVDNAATVRGIYHLIFTDDGIYVFMTMSRRESMSKMWHAQMSNPARLVPVTGAASNYEVSKEETMLLITENLERGKEIEQNLETKLNENPDGYELIEYTSISSIELDAGNLLKTPELLIRAAGKRFKFHLTGYNFQGSGKLPEEILSGYENTLKMAVGDRLVVKR